MAARENQGLQVAIIIFVVLTITLSVSTFVLFRNYEEALVQKNLALQDQRDAVQRAAALQSENGELKQIIGAGDGDALPAIQQRFQADAKDYAGSFKDRQPHYRQLVAYLHAELAGSDARFVAAKQREEQLRAQIAAGEQVKIGEVAKYVAQLEASVADLASERNIFNQARGDVELSKDDLAKQMDANRKDTEREAAKAIASIKELTAALNKLEFLYGAVRDRIAETERFADLPRGEITWVSQRDRLVTLNLGDEDGLRRQATFKVLAADEPNVLGAPSKGKIEVVRVIDKHRAEARILDDQIANPILPGDKIFSLAWAPRRTEHFALAGFMDLDGDHVSDRERIKRLIVAHGGVIDAEVGDDGKRNGEMSLNTRYVICGERPSGERTSLDLIKAYSSLLDEATTLGVRRMPLQEFLNNVGYTPGPRMAALDGGGGADDFASRSPDGVRRKSSGQFTPRKPKLGSSRPSAY